MNLSKKTTCYQIIFLLFLLFSTNTTKGEIKLVPTFESCSVYIPCDSITECSILYKLMGESDWRETFQPVFDSTEMEYRTSIVRLKEDSNYDVKVLMKNSDKTIELTGNFKTWNSNPAINKTLYISSFDKNEDGSIRIDKLAGNVDGWIKIIGDIPIHAGIENEAALFISNCHYIIFENLIVKGGYRHGIKTNETSSNIRFANCDISKWGRISNKQNERGHYLDENGEEINNDAGFTVYKSQNIVLERSYIHDPNGYTNPWNGIVEMGEHKGKQFIFSHPQGPTAVYIMESKGGIVLRYNDLVGSQTHRYNDIVEAWQNRDINGGFARDADIYGNVMAFGQDDGIELDGGQCNVRLFDNRIEQIYCGVSTAPNKKGPSYIFNNVIWNIGNSLGLVGNAIKNGGGVVHTRGVQFLFNNTIIHNGGGMIGVGYGDGGPENKRELFYAYTRNNIFYSQRSINDSIREGYCINDLYQIPHCDFDYDMLGNSTDPEGRGTVIAIEGSEKNGVFASPVFTNLNHGVLTLLESDPGIGKGQYLPNFSKSHEHGIHSIGAFELGESSLIPQRPLKMESDKYYVRLITGKTELITIKIGDQPDSGFKIKMAEDMEGWLKVKTNKKRIKKNSVLKLKLKASDAEHVRNGMIFVRLDNGLSLPITVVAEN